MARYQMPLRRIKLEEALSFLDQVKDTFGSHSEEYNDFISLMKDFKFGNIDILGVIHTICSLFRDHPELILGFNTFLPPGYRIEVTRFQISSYSEGICISFFGCSYDGFCGGKEPVCYNDTRSKKAYAAKVCSMKI